MQHDDLQTSEDIGYDPDTGSYHLDHDWESAESLSFTVMRLILVLTGEEHRSVSPLWKSVDPDALDRMFRAERPSAHPHDRVTFTHEDCRVTVQRDGHVYAFPPR